MEKAKDLRNRLYKIADSIKDDFDDPDILSTLLSCRKGVDAIEKVVGYCNDKLYPIPIEKRASPERLRSRNARAKARKKPEPHSFE